MSILSTFKLDLEQAELDIIGKALGQLPYYLVQPLLTKLQVQINDQSLAAHQAAATGDANAQA